MRSARDGEAELARLLMYVDEAVGRADGEWEEATRPERETREPWFWQALGEALIQIRRAKGYLQVNNREGAAAALATARQRIVQAGRMIGPRTRATRAGAGLAVGLRAVWQAQWLLATGSPNLTPAMTAVRQALGAIHGAMRLALRGEARVPN